MGACAQEDAPEPEAAPSTGETKKAGKDKERDPADGDATDPGAGASNLADVAEDLANQNRGAIEPRNEPVLGGDVSWPQCPRAWASRRGAARPADAPRLAEFVIIGLTNGPGFTPNPCLADQVAWVRERGLMAAAYAVTSYPDAATLGSTAGGPFDGDTTSGR